MCASLVCYLCLFPMSHTLHPAPKHPRSPTSTPVLSGTKTKTGCRQCFGIFGGILPFEPPSTDSGMGPLIPPFRLNNCHDLGLQSRLAPARRVPRLLSSTQFVCPSFRVSSILSGRATAWKGSAVRGNTLVRSVPRRDQEETVYKHKKHGCP